MRTLDCGHKPSPHGKGTTGYGKGTDGKTYCYECCADRDRDQMDRDGRATHYLTKKDNGLWYVSNWPGTMKYRCGEPKKGYHNIAGTRYDVWFNDHKGKLWHGVNYGSNSQVCHLRRLKYQEPKDVTRSVETLAEDKEPTR